jgi:endonuclease/exonuclease/phosphatase family metal-dependent hydrolase
MGNFSNFLQNLDGLLRKLYAKNCEFINCGDFNINYLKANLKEKILLNTMFASYNLFSTVNFPTRIQNNHISSIDHIFINFTTMTGGRGGAAG